MKRLLIVLIFAFPALAISETIYRIEVGNDYKRYSQKDLQRRVWELERAVFQLQQKVFELEMKGGGGTATWICKISAMGEVYSGIGPSKAVAEHEAIKACKADQDGMFCKSPKCEN